jgi:hypothetical protein
MQEERRAWEVGRHTGTQKAGWQRTRQECMQAKSSKETEPGQQTDNQAGAGKSSQRQKQAARGNYVKFCR